MPDKRFGHCCVSHDQGTLSPTLPSGATGKLIDRLTGVLGVEHLQGVHHGTGEYIGVLLAAKVEAVDLSGVTPLVEGLRGLIVLQTLGDCTVYHHLVTTTTGREKGKKHPLDGLITGSSCVIMINRTSVSVLPKPVC